MRSMHVFLPGKEARITTVAGRTGKEFQLARHLHRLRTDAPSDSGASWVFLPLWLIPVSDVVCGVRPAKSGR